MKGRGGFSLAPKASVDLGKLKDLSALSSFLTAWRSKAAEVPIIGAPGSAQREAHLRLRATAVLPAMRGIGTGAESVDAIVNTAKHLARPAQVGEAAMFSIPPSEDDHVYLVPPDVRCAVCNSDELELMPSSGVPAKLAVHGLDGTRPGTAYKKVCRSASCGAVHRYNEIEVPKGMRLMAAVAPPSTQSSSAQPTAQSSVQANAERKRLRDDEPSEADAQLQKRRCFRRDVLDQPFFRATAKTVYTKEMLDWTSILLESTQASFDGVTRSARAVHREVDNRLDRVERRNLATVWFAHEALEAVAEAGLEVPSPDDLGIAARQRIGRDRQQKATLRRVTKGYREAFRKKNLENHSSRCTRPGRCRFAAIDGIHNLITDKCRTEVRHYHLLGRWGQRELGCVNPPAPGSAYCEECLDAGGLRTPQKEDPEFQAEARADAEQTAAALTEAASAAEVPAAADLGAFVPLACTAAPAATTIPAAIEIASGIADASTRSVRAITAQQRGAFAARFTTRQAPLTKLVPGEDSSDDDSDDNVAALHSVDSSDDDDSNDEGKPDTFKKRYLERGARHNPIKKDVYVVQFIEAEDTSDVGIRLVLVKWSGWKHPTWEPREHLSPLVLKAYDAKELYGASKYPSMLKDPSAPILEHTPYEKEVYGKKGRCTTHKEEQKRWSKVSL